MPELAALLEALGCTGTSTYLQSGNALVDSDLPPDVLTARVEQALAETGLAVRVLARTLRDLEAVVDGDPFAGRDLDPTLLHVAFLDDAPRDAALDGLDLHALLPEGIVVRGREAYLWYSRGVRESRLAAPLRRLGVVATARNWRTVLALRDLLRS